jgi:hypothetical protein
VKLQDAAALVPYLDDDAADFIVARATDLARFPDALRARLAPIGAFGEYRLLHETPR